MPNITGTFDTLLNGTLSDGGYTSGLKVNHTSGAFYTEKTANTDWHLPSTYIGSNTNGHDAGRFNASRCSSVYQSVTEVRPDNFSINYFIKY